MAEKVERLVERLRECPFCGSCGEIINRAHEPIHVRCTGADCGVQIWGTGWHFANEEAAAFAWNRRASNDALRTQEAVREEALEEAAKIANMHACHAWTHDARSEADTIAAIIRALKEPASLTPSAKREGQSNG